MKFIFLFLTFCLSLAAHAQLETRATSESAENLNNKNQANSEAWFFPAAGKPLFQVTPGYISTEQAYTGHNLDYSRGYTEESVNLSFDAALGHSTWALHFATFDGQGASTVSQNGVNHDYKFAGVGDLFFGARTLFRFENSMQIYTGADLSYSLSDGEIATASTTGSLNSGGPSLLPFVAFDTPTPYGSAGAGASYRIFGDAHSEGRNASGQVYENVTKSGRRVLSLAGFNEWTRPRFTMGVLGDLDFVSSFSTSNSRTGNFSDDPTAFLIGRAYGKIRLSPVLDLIPSLQYSTLLTRSVNNVNTSRSDDFILAFGLGVTL